MLDVNQKDDCMCISCCNKNKRARKIRINRADGTYEGDNITTFSLCEDCLRKLAREFVPYS